jgi:hypothetical protein
MYSISIVDRDNGRNEGTRSRRANKFGEERRTKPSDDESKNERSADKRPMIFQ